MEQAIDMPYAPHICLGIGLVFALVYGLLLANPRTARERLLAFPRNRFVAEVLTAVSLLWFAANLWQVDFGPYSTAKPLLYVLTPVAWFLMVRLIPDLLAVRAVCFLILLGGNPLLVHVRWHGSLAHYSVAVLVYILVIKAMVLVIYPNLWRRGILWMYDDPAAPRRSVRLARAGLALALYLIAAGILSF